MCGAQRLQCKSESAPQIIGAHQPIKRVMCTLMYTVLKAQSQHEEEGAQQLGQQSHTVRTPQPRDRGLFLISESGRGEGAQLLASQPDYMEFAMQATTEWERGHIWDILATVQPQEQCCISREKTTGDLKSHHLQAGAATLSVPPPFLSAVQEKKVLFFKGTHGLFGGHVPLRPPLGSGTAYFQINYFYYYPNGVKQKKKTYPG